MRITADAVAICLAFIFGLVLADLWLAVEQSGRATSSEQAQSADDGWRRTANGWELSRWSRQPHDPLRACFHNRDVAPMPQHRWDFHPAWLAAGQLAAVAGIILLQQTSQERRRSAE